MAFTYPAWAEQTVIVLVNIFIAFAAGSATELRKFRRVSKIAPVLPILSQFICQPLIVSGFCALFDLNAYVRAGMILCATCPSGNGSNIAEVIFGGDVELGILTTFFSTIVSAGAIPLNYRLIISPLLPLQQDGRAAPIPWAAIGTAAAILIGGTSMGSIVRYVNDSLGRRLEYWLIKIGVLLLIAGIIVALTQTAEIWPLLEWNTFVCALLLPPWKFLLVYAGSRLLRLPLKIAETASMEAGEQNIAVALAIISLAFPLSPERNLMVGGLMLYTLFNQAIATPLVTFVFWRWGGKRTTDQPTSTRQLPERATTTAAAAADAPAPTEEAGGADARATWRCFGRLERHRAKPTPPERALSSRMGLSVCATDVAAVSKTAVRPSAEVTGLAQSVV